MFADTITLQESPTQKHVYDIVQGDHLLGTCYIRVGIKQIKLFKMISLFQLVGIGQVILEEHERLAYYERNNKKKVVDASIPSVS